MKIKFEFTDGTVESYEAGKVEIITESFAGEHTIEKKINQALMKGGVFEVPPLPRRSLIDKVRINSHSVKKVTLIKDEKDN